MTQSKSDGSYKTRNIQPPAEIKEEKKNRFKFRFKGIRKQQNITEKEPSFHDRLAAILYRSTGGKLDDSAKKELAQFVQSQHLVKVQKELADERNVEGGEVSDKLMWVMKQLDAIDSKEQKKEPLTVSENKRKVILEKQKEYLENCFIQLNNPKVDQREEARLLSHEALFKTADLPASKKVSRGFFTLFERKKGKTRKLATPVSGVKGVIAPTKGT